MFFVIKNGNNVTKSPELKQYTKGLYIYFTRYGLVKKENSFLQLSTLFPEQEKNNILNSKELPEVEGYKFVRRTIRDGYLYVYKKSIKEWYEYKVKDGILKNIK